MGEVDIKGKTDKGDLTNADENVEWRYLDFANERHEVKYSCCEEIYPDLTFNLKVKRKATFYVMHIILPYIITSAIALFSYALPAESGEKVSLCVTILLALTVFLLLLGDTLPPYSDSIPLVGKYLVSYISTCKLSIFSLFESHTHSGSLWAFHSGLFTHIIPLAQYCAV